MNYNTLQSEYETLLSTMEVRPEWKDAIDRKARGIYANKARYQVIEDETGVPWQVVGIIHSLECNLNFNQALHNGDEIIGKGKKTYRVPRGRGPFATWEEAAIDAVRYDGLNKIEDWSDAMVCFALEKYNGFGYRTRRTGVLSPYLWSGTTHYTVGKFVSDGKYVKSAKSSQIGAIPLYLRVKEIDIPKKEIVAKSSKLTLISRVRKWFAGLSLGTVLADLMGFLEQVKEYIIANPSTVVWALVGFSSLGFVIFKLLEGKGVQDYEEGRYTPSGQ